MARVWIFMLFLAPRLPSKFRASALLPPFCTHLALPGPWGGVSGVEGEGLPLYCPSLRGVGPPVADVSVSPFFSSSSDLPWDRAVSRGSGSSMDMGRGLLT